MIVLLLFAYISINLQSCSGGRTCECEVSKAFISGAEKLVKLKEEVVEEFLRRVRRFIVALDSKVLMQWMMTCVEVKGIYSNINFEVMTMNFYHSSSSSSNTTSSP